MAERKSFLLRIDRDTLDAVQRWANDDLRSLNGQIEFLLRRALQQTERAPTGNRDAATIDPAEQPPEARPDGSANGGTANNSPDHTPFNTDGDAGQV